MVVPRVHVLPCTPPWCAPRHSRAASPSASAAAGGQIKLTALSKQNDFILREMQQQVFGLHSELAPYEAVRHCITSVKKQEAGCFCRRLDFCSALCFSRKRPTKTQ